MGLDVVCKCPRCDGFIIEKEKIFCCSNFHSEDGIKCTVGAARMLPGAVISREEMIELIDGNTIEKELSAHDNKWIQQIKFNKSFTELELVKVEE